MPAKFLDEVLTRAPGAWIQSADPAVANPTWMAVDVLWIDTTGTPAVLKKRNATNDGWDIIDLLGLKTRTISTSDIAEDDDDVVFVDTSGGAVTFTLLPAADRTRPLTVKNITDGANLVTIDGDDSETIDGTTTVELAGRDKVTLLPRSSSAWESI